MRGNAARVCKQPDCTQIQEPNAKKKRRSNYDLQRALRGRHGNAVRKLHLCGDLAELLNNFIADRKDGFLFRNDVGRPLSQRNVLGRSLHPILEKLHMQKQGFHGFRRFRLTWFRKNRVPGDLERFWMGHADHEIGDLYSKMEEEAEFCKQVADAVDLGFQLPDAESVKTPDVAPIAPKTQSKESVA